MAQQEDIVTQIRALMDQQLESLRGKLPGRELLACVRRSERISELLDRLVKKDAWAEVT
jgi:hypothetical protein